MIKSNLTILLLLLSFSLHASLPDHRYPDVVHYRFEVFLNDSTDFIKVIADLKCRIGSSQRDSIAIDFERFNAESMLGMQVSELKLNNSKAKWKWSGQKLLIDAKSVSDSIFDLSIAYHGQPSDGLIISKNQFGDRTFFADHWPDRAHHWLPVVDHPSEKATCEFIVTAPSHYDVVANGDLGSIMQLDNGFKTTTWVQRQPISAKVMVMGVADFLVQNIDDQGFSKAWVYHQSGEAAFRDFKEAYDIYWMFYERMGEFPFSKLDHIESTTLYLGMENAGNIFYDEKKVNGNGQIGGLIAHEIGHQWFGNGVTEADWSDIWLSESFAKYCMYYFIEQRYGADSLQGLLQHDELKIARYEKKNPEKTIIVQDISNPRKILSPLVYEKGARVLRSLEQELGRQVFWNVLRAYYQKYKFNVATTEDFIAMAERLGGKPLDKFFSQWLYTPGHPILTYKLDNLGKLTVIQKTNYTYELTLGLLVKEQDGAARYQRIHLSEKKQEYDLKGLNGNESVILDPYNFVYAELTELGR